MNQIRNTMPRTVERYIVIDLEATTDSGPDHERLVPCDEMETIEIGAVLVNASTLQIESEFERLVRPIRHPSLTRFCTELTGITQAMVADAPPFPEAMKALFAQMPLHEPDVVWGSWGRFDETQLQRDCAHHDVPYSMPPHLNLKRAFSTPQGRRKQYGLAKALQIGGLELEGDHHRALADARNTARLLPWIKGVKKIR